jgi:thiamine-monophosphate kinase
VAAKLSLSEHEIIARFFAPIAAPGGLRLLDDAACLTSPYGCDTVLTTDALVADVHFFPEDAPRSIAIKALGVNLSDLAAKGARPAGFLLSLALPDTIDDLWLEGFTDGLKTLSQQASCPLLGGDTVRTSGPLMISITAIGFVPSSEMLLRSKAESGDHLVVSGTIGDAVLGLALRKGEANWSNDIEEPQCAFLLDRYLHPAPRFALADILRRYARAAMDISDGLAGDVAKLVQASSLQGSHLTAQIDTCLIPVSKAAQSVLKLDPAWLDRMLTGGDDYELLMAVPPGHLATLIDQSRQKGIVLTRIGQIVPGSGLPSFHSGKQKKIYDKGSYSHF